MKEILIYNLPHGYNIGGVIKTDICPTITAAVGRWLPAIVEVEMIEKIGKLSNSKIRNQVYSAKGISPTLVAGAGTGGNNIPLIVVGTMDNTFESTSRVYDVRGVSPTLNTCNGGGHEPKVIVAMRGRENGQQLEINHTGKTNTITSVAKDNYVMEIENYKIRKLTPNECWRLMGFSDEDFEKAEWVNSNSQLYKQAGNSIVVNVLERIFKEML